MLEIFKTCLHGTGDARNQLTWCWYIEYLWMDVLIEAKSHYLPSSPFSFCIVFHPLSSFHLYIIIPLRGYCVSLYLHIQLFPPLNYIVSAPFPFALPIISLSLPFISLASPHTIIPSLPPTPPSLYSHHIFPNSI